MPTLPAARPATNGVLLLFLLAIAGCAPQPPRITPINDEFNQMMLGGEGLDPRLYGTRERLQYFEAAHLAALPPAQARAALDGFIRTHYGMEDVARLETLAVLVYRSSAFARYGDLVHDSARNNEGGLLWEQGDRTLAQVRFEKVGQGPQWTRHMVVYRHGAIVLNEDVTANAARFFHR